VRITQSGEPSRGRGWQGAGTPDAVTAILYEKSLNLKTISQGDFGHFRENNLIILSEVAKIALRDCF
jgi:hypothetical protein